MEHKAEVIEFETYMACKAWACQAIVKAVDKEWVSEKHDKDIGYQAMEPWNSSIYFTMPVETWTTMKSQTSTPRCWSRGTEWKHL